jgi:hypothetical protein
MWYLPTGNEEASSGKPAARGLDVSIPNVARIYDFMLGGKDNFAADRDAAARVIQQMPHSVLVCRQNRDFLGRVVRYLAVDRGIRQFLDIGSGLPASGNVHEIAQASFPESRVVYVDHDSIVVSHARALLQSAAPAVMAAEVDLRDPRKILEEAQGLIDFSEPVAVLLFAVLHFLTDAEEPREIVGSLTAALAPGSALAISHFTAEGIGPERSLAVQEIYQGASAPIIPRSRRNIVRFFDGLELTAPGVTDINLWSGGSPGPEAPLTFYGGVALKP